MYAQWAVGLVISTGHDTKVMMSIAKAPEKSSHLNARINTVSWSTTPCMLPYLHVGARLLHVFLQQSTADSCWGLLPIVLRACCLLLAVLLLLLLSRRMFGSVRFAPRGLMGFCHRVHFVRFRCSVAAHVRSDAIIYCRVGRSDQRKRHVERER